MKQGTHLFQFLTYTLNNCLLNFMVFVFGSVSIICYGLAPGLVVPIATQQGIRGGSCGGSCGGVLGVGY